MKLQILKLNKENCKIDWSQSTTDIHNLIRGLSPYPAAWCYFTDKGEEWNVKIYEVKTVFEEHSYAIGTLICSKKEMKVATKEGYIQILSIQFPGKKKMTAAELLNGISFSEDAKVK
jgi:methionyl-tRNA formyltransferase